MWQSLLCLVVSCTYNPHQDDLLSGDNIVVTSFLHEPFLSLKDNHQDLTGNDKYEGFLVDMLDAAGDILGARFNINIVKDAKYGQCKHDNCSDWTGMMGEVVRGEADLAVADLTIAPKRVLAVDFTQPFMNGGLVVLAAEPDADSVEELVDQGYKFLIIKGGSTELLFKTNQHDLYKKIWSNTQLISNNKEGQEMVMQSNKKVAFILEQFSAKYMMEEDPSCRLKIVGNSLNSVSYGMAMARGVAKKTAEGVFEIRQTMDMVITQMKYDGTLSRLEDKWWPESKC